MPSSRGPRPVRFAAALYLALVACHGSTEHDTLEDLAASASGDRDVACAGAAQLSDAVPFQPADLGDAGRSNADQSRVLTGPRTRAVAQDSSDWVRVWTQAVDSAPPPAVSFGDDALILVATPAHSVAPTHIAVEAVRRCRSSDALVVAVRENSGRGGGEDVWSRGLIAIRIGRAEVTHGTIRFADLRTADR